MPSALITGIAGQDGSYLAELLLGKGYEVHGLVRRHSSEGSWRLTPFLHAVNLHRGDLLDAGSLANAVSEIQPDEVYNLGSVSFVGTSWSQPLVVGEINALGTTRVLEAVRRCHPQARVYQASTSEMFGLARASPQNELTPFHPRSPYAVSKVYAHHATVNYRESYGMFSCCGTLFNHESPRRGIDFVTRKITHTAAAIKLGLGAELSLGNLDARRDWGFAGDYVETMWLMLQQAEPTDYVIGTGATHSVRDVVETAFSHLGLDSGAHVRSDPRFRRPADVEDLVADPSKAAAELGWKASTTFTELIEMMVDADTARLSRNPEGFVDSSDTPATPLDVRP